MKQFILISLIYCCHSLCFAQKNADTPLYQSAFDKISSMLEDNLEYSFKDAIFYTENAFLEGQLDSVNFESKIQGLVFIINKYSLANQNNFNYDYEDKAVQLKRASIFKVMTDTIPIQYGNEITIENHPYGYDFKDAMGKEDWTKMFVSKLLDEHNGNCHSLPYLYKVLAEEIGISAHLSIAPSHMYIKHSSKQTGMYNTELTSATFPIDAWLMSSGYIHLDAIRSGIYMDTLDNKESLALCLLDLAKGFERKYGMVNDSFILKCINQSLKYYPNSINALLFKSELLLRKYRGKTTLNPIFIFEEYEKLIIKIHQLGYRKMPEKMYQNWLLDLNENKEKYRNKKLVNKFKTE